jgi:hypothetical protein
MGLKKQSGLNSFTLTPKQWIEKTSAIGLISKPGRYGGTYAHKDIAYEFASWISVEFKLYLIKEFQRLKDEERKQLGWDIRRNLAKINERIHTEAIKENLIPAELTRQQITRFMHPKRMCSIWHYSVKGYLHKHGSCERIVFPENPWGSEGNVIIFQFSRKKDPDTATGFTCGSDSLYR